MKHRSLFALLAFLNLLAVAPGGRAQGVAPVITGHPANQVAALGTTAVFGVSATSDWPLSYRWFKDGVALEARTSPWLVLSIVTAADEGFYFAEVSNAYGVADNSDDEQLSDPIYSVEQLRQQGVERRAADFLLSVSR